VCKDTPDGQKIGEVTSGAFSPNLQKNIAMGSVLVCVGSGWWGRGRCVGVAGGVGRGGAEVLRGGGGRGAGREAGCG
jgi:hypothetical protein